jgi:hypothetical protein
MKYSTGSRISVNDVNCTVVITDWKGNPITVKRDSNDKMFDVKPGDKLVPIVQK